MLGRLWPKLLGAFGAVLIAGLAWAQTYTTNSIPYGLGPGHKTFGTAGPCPAGFGLGWVVSNGVPQCVNFSGGSGGSGGISGISTGVTQATTFSNGDFIAVNNGLVIDSGISTAISQLATGCAGNTTGGVITSSGTISVVEVATSVINSGTTLTDTQCGYTIILSAGTPFTVTVPAAGGTGFGTGVNYNLCNYGSAAVTLSGGTAATTIGSGGTYVMPGGTVNNPYCLQILFLANNSWAVKDVTPTATVANIIIGTTTLTGSTTGFCLVASGGVVQNQACSSSIVAGSSVTSGISSGDLIGSTSNVAVDSGIAWVNLGLLNGNQTWSGSNIFSGTANFTGTFQGGGNTLTLPPTADTIAGLAQAQTWTGIQTLSGGVVTKHIKVQVRQVNANATIDKNGDYFLCVDSTSGPITITIPGTPGTGDTYLIKDCAGTAGSNAITLTPPFGVAIDGAGTLVLSTNYQSVAITYTGSQWSVN